MRCMARSPRRGLLFVCMAMFAMAACGTTTASTTGTPAATGTASTSSTTSTTSTTSTSTVTASTALCDLMSLSQVSAVVGATLSMLNRTVTMAGSSTAVNCTYLPSGVHVAAEISYLFSQNGQASYAADKQDQASRGEQETSISGLGDAAFWAVAAKDKGTLQLSVLKGNVLLIMTLLGTNPDGSSMLNGAIALARQALPSF
jgi:hypothetical protein